MLMFVFDCIVDRMILLIKLLILKLLKFKDGFIIYIYMIDF